ncbi:MAG: nucleotide exchange factor GrpE [Alteripontixanthobacter sp.]
MSENEKPGAEALSEDEKAKAEELKGVPEEMLADNDGEEGADEEPSVEDALAELRENLAKANQDVLYARAETQNVRRRMEKDVSDARAYAATGFARDILSVADNLSRAVDAIPEDLREDSKFKGLVAGIQATQRELDKVFGQHGITRVAAVGLPLDPNQHQAMMEVPTDDAEAGTVVQEMQSGYMIRDRLLRPAMVGVAKKPD